MVQTPTPVPDWLTDDGDRLTFADFLQYEDSTDTKYELVRGFLQKMPTATMLHVSICQFLLYRFREICSDKELGLLAGCDVSVRTEDKTGRIPDVVVNTVEHWQAAGDRQGGAAFHHGETPALVVEVVSTNWKDDYLLKHGEYAYIGIPEYWIVDPQRELIRICTQTAGEDGYSHQDFKPGDTIKSVLFPQLNLTVDEIFEPILVEEMIQSKTELQQELEAEKRRSQQLETLLREKGISLDELS
ncbi:MAG: Uma2 family endonuclease [Limnothrix sp. RL_2_0]|nr:Uma2 family endonuclease [Limnothrix sp. RL_2_0]